MGYFFQQQQIIISLIVIWNVQRNTALQGRLTEFRHRNWYAEGKCLGFSLTITINIWRV